MTHRTKAMWYGSGVTCATFFPYALFYIYARPAFLWQEWLIFGLLFCFSFELGWLFRRMQRFNETLDRLEKDVVSAKDQFLKPNPPAIFFSCCGQTYYLTDETYTFMCRCGNIANRGVDF